MSQPVSKPNTVQVPWTTLVLIVLNLGASLLAAVDQDVRIDYAFDPAQPSLLTAFVSLFLHANLIHLLGNMVFLAAVGPRVESVAGRWRYLTIYFLGGIFGVLTHLLVMRSIGASTPVLGASGAIASCAGYCAVRFMNRKVPLAPRVNVTIGTVTLVWVGLQALGAFVKLGHSDGTGSAFWTHLAGFSTGLVLSVVFAAPKQARLQFGHEVLDQMVARGPAALLQAAELHLAEHPGDVRALQEIASAARQTGERDKETGALNSLLDLVPTASQPAVLSDLELADGWASLSPKLRLQYAEKFKGSQLDIAKRLVSSVVNDRQAEVMKPDALLALALLEDGAKRRDLIQELMSTYPLHAASQIAEQMGLKP